MVGRFPGQIQQTKYVYRMGNDGKVEKQLVGESAAQYALDTASLR
jgi:hypothetical protein